MGRDRFAVLKKKREGSEEVDQGGEEDVGVALPDDGEGTAEAHEEAETEEGQGETNEGEEEGVGEGGDGDGIGGAIGEGVVMPDLKCGSLDAEAAEGVELEADIDFFDVVGEGAGNLVVDLWNHQKMTNNWEWRKSTACVRGDETSGLEQSGMS